MDTQTAQRGADSARRAKIITLPAPPPLDISERDFQRLITDLAEWCGWYWWHDQDSRGNDAGLPDLILMRRRLMWREVKTLHGRVRPAQLAFGQRLLRAGGDWQIWRPSMWDAIVTTLTAEE